jgi:putative hydrolase of the HAD superfamily
MTTGPIRALMLDLDNTLLDERYVATASRAACDDVAAQHGALDTATLVTANAEEWRAYWPEVESAWTLGRLETSTLRAEIWRRTLDRFGLADEASVASAAASHHGHELRQYPLFDDALPLLESASRAGVLLAIVTNGASDTQREKLAILGIADLFDAIIVSGEVGAAKPDPRIFEVALATLEVDAADAVHVGDSLRLDVGGALAAGIHAVWLNRTGAARSALEPRPDREVSTLDQLAMVWTVGRA